jgi:hypothetical protein
VKSINLKNSLKLLKIQKNNNQKLFGTIMENIKMLQAKNQNKNNIGKFYKIIIKLKLQEI